MTDGDTQGQVTSPPATAGHEGGRAGMMRAAALLGLGATLVWLIVSHSLAAWLAQASPGLALSLNSDQPAALIALAGAELAKAQQASGPEPASDPATGSASRVSRFASSPNTGAQSQPADAAKAEGPEATPGTDPEEEASGADASPLHDGEAIARIRELAERALVSDPLNARAFRLLAQVAEAEDVDAQAAQAAQLAQAAARRSLRETAAVNFLMRLSFDAGDYAGAIDRADTILRTAPRLAPHVVPILARIAETPEARPLLEQRLAANPPWRRTFFATLPNAISDARTPLELLLSLRGSEAPPTEADLSGYAHFLLRHDFAELAYYAWLQFLPPEQLASVGLLFNGNFEHSFSDLPFDWQIASGSGAVVQVTPAADLETGRALQIEFGQGRVNFGHVQQTVVLAPGVYRFEGRFKGELTGRRGLIWRIACAGRRRELLASTPMITGRAPAWRSFDAAFTVPDNDCRAQTVRLTHDARSESERFISGVLWFAELKIVRQ